MSNLSPHHRHQASLEGVIDLSAQTQSLNPEERAQATRIFHSLIELYEPSQSNEGPYKQITLVRLTYEHAHSEASRDNFLKYFFKCTEIPIEPSQWERVRSHDLAPQLKTFAELLVQHFFLPLKAASKKTPQPTPTQFSESQGAQTHTGVTARLAALRGQCLARDRHRCVISRRFDSGEALKRIRRDGEAKAQDNDGRFLKDEAGTFTTLEVAHIIPHSLMGLPKGEAELGESKKTALAILNMFDDGVVHLIAGTDIDRSTNAITLTHEHHQLFGDFEVFFEPDCSLPHTYLIDTTRSGIMRLPIFPVRRTLFLTDSRTIDPPSPRLLAVHRAIALILHVSAAGEYIDKILKSLEEGAVRADGSTELGLLIMLRLQGVWDGQITAY